MKYFTRIVVLLILIAGEVICSNWQTIFTGQTNMLRGVFFINTNTGFAVGEGVIVKTTNSGNNWTISNSRFNLKSVFFIDVQTGFAIGKSNDSGFVLKTTNSGSTWTSQYLSFLSAGYEYQRVLFVNTTTGYIMNQSANWYKTTNAGLFWVLNNPLAGYNIRDVGKTSTLFYAVGRNTGSVLKPAYWTSNDEINFSSAIICNECSNGDYGQRLRIFDTVSYLVTGSSLESPSNLYRKTSSHPNWQSIGGGNYLQTFFVNENYGFYCSYGVPNSFARATSNGGVSWVYDTLFAIGSRDIFFCNSTVGFVVGDNGLIGKTINGGGTIGVEVISTNVPDKFSLMQNYPNPFNPITIIEFTLPQKQFIKLKIFDSMGREIETLANQDLAIGSYRVSWNAGNFSSGIYYYRIEGKDFTTTRKMVLIK